MRFADPIWLVIGAATVTVLAVFLARAEILRMRALARLAGTRLRASLGSVPSRARRWARAFAITFAVAMAFVALARPQRGLRWETASRKGTDILLVVDTSRSMDADDVKPTRLERTKLAIRDLVEKFPGDRVGLVAFAGDAFVQSPMTLDHDALLQTVDALDTSIVARGGTDVGHAIDVAAAALGTEPDHQKSIVLLTDGEDLEGQGLAEAKKAHEQGIVIDTVGVGSTGGELVPQKDERGRTVGLVRDEQGAPVRSHLDEEGLRGIAQAAGGSYAPLGADGNGLMRLYDQALAPRAHVETAARTHRVYADWFEIPLGLALGGILLDALLALGWRKLRPGRAAVGLAAAAALVLVPRVVLASTGDAAKAYAAGRFEEAEKEYTAESTKHPNDMALAYNAGDAAYRAGHFDVAREDFDRARKLADPKLKEQVLYNQGNTLYRAGEHTAADAIEAKRTAWKAAIAAYDDALAAAPKDDDARFNRDFVKRKLAELDKKDPPKKDPPKEEKGKEDPKNGGGAGKDQKPQPGNSPKGNPQPGQGSKPQNGAPPGEQKQDAQSGGGLSASEARALVNGLKGEERHAAVRGHDTATSADDSPRKDW